jgi:hypothetical protein
VGLLGSLGLGYLVSRRQGPPAVAAVRPQSPPDPASAPLPAREYTEGSVKPDTAASSGVQPRRSGEPPPRARRDAGATPDRGKGIAPEKPAASARPAAGAATAVAPDTGRLLLRSTPADATVLVDGRERGRTPVTIGDLARGTHRVHITRAGYVAEDRRIVITAARPSASLIVTLARQPATVDSPGGSSERTPAPRSPATLGTATGTLTVESRPAGARVLLDGKFVGTTPAAIPDVDAGSHAIQLELEGHRGWSTSIRVVSGKQNRVTASLEQ